MVVKKRRPPSEIFAFIGCFLILAVALIQIIVFSQKNRAAEQTQTFSRRGLISGHMNAYLSMHKQDQSGKRSTYAALSPQAKMRARSKANQEVRELEKALAKLMRENSMTPDEARIKIQNELYARRVKGIINKAETGSLIPLKQNGSRLRADPLEVFNNTGFHRNHANVQENDGNIFRSVPYLNSPYNSQLTGEHLGMHSGALGNNVFSKGQMSRLKHVGNARELHLKNASSGDLQERNSSTEFLDMYTVAGSYVQEVSELYMDEDIQRMQSGSNQALCPAIPKGLVGNATAVTPNITVSISEIIKNNSDVVEGGEWKPAACISRHKVAIIIPYRDRWDHLKVLLHYLIPTLKRQEIHFRIFVGEQYGNETFNKGRIMNAAFREALKLFDFHCVTFHDVDLIPEDDRNVYSCMEQPKHMSFSIDKFQYVLPYDGLVGGVLMFKTEHFELVNGYSNMYWGWGAEDDDMTTRILHHGLRIYRPPSNIAKYKMVKHDGRKSSEVAVRMKLLRSAARRSKLEGLNNVQYKLVATHIERMFTHFVIDIGHP